MGPGPPLGLRHRTPIILLFARDPENAKTKPEKQKKAARSISSPGKTQKPKGKLNRAACVLRRGKKSTGWGSDQAEIFNNFCAVLSKRISFPWHRETGWRSDRKLLREWADCHGPIWDRRDRAALSFSFRPDRQFALPTGVGHRHDFPIRTLRARTHAGRRFGVRRIFGIGDRRGFCFDDTSPF